MLNGEIKMNEKLCPLCGEPLYYHSVIEYRVTEKFVYLKLGSGSKECEFLGLIIS